MQKRIYFAPTFWNLFYTMMDNMFLSNGDNARNRQSRLPLHEEEAAADEMLS